VLVAWGFVIMFKRFSFDIETTGLDPYRGARTFSYATCCEQGHIGVYRFDSPKVGETNSAKMDLLLSDTSIEKICHNYHFELAVLRSENRTIPAGTVWHDTMIMGQLLHNLLPSHALDEFTTYSRKM
jgi:hypothetical protein